MLFGAMAFTWIFMPAYSTMHGFISSDIINGNCVPLGAYSSYATEKTVVFFLVFFTYILPLMLMVFFYSKLVYALRTKVTLLALSLISPVASRRASSYVQPSTSDKINTAGHVCPTLRSQCMTPARSSRFHHVRRHLSTSDTVPRKSSANVHGLSHKRNTLFSCCRLNYVPL